MKKLIFSTVVGMFAIASVAAASSLTQSQIDAIISMLRSFGAEESVIANVRISLTGGGPITPPTQWCHTFNTNLGVGSRGAEIAALQTALSRADIDTGTGSSDPTPLFNEYVAAAVTGFQEKYKSEILAPIGLAHGTGYVGPATRKKLNQLYGCSKPSPVACTQDARQCPDGSYVSRTGPKCEFATCPGISYTWTVPSDKALYANVSWQKITSKRFAGFTPFVQLTEKKTGCLPSDLGPYLRREGMCGTGYWLEEAGGNKIDSDIKLRSRFAPVESAQEAVSFVSAIQPINANVDDVINGYTAIISGGFLVKVKGVRSDCGFSLSDGTSFQPTTIFKVTTAGIISLVAQEVKPKNVTAEWCE